jgi:hypothetical protein
MRCGRSRTVLTELDITVLPPEDATEGRDPNGSGTALVKEKISESNCSQTVLRLDLLW